MSFGPKSPLPVIAVLLAGLTLMSTAPGAYGDGETGLISGRVFDSLSMLPLSGAMVVLDGNSSMWMTNHDGDYIVPDVPYGIHRIRAFIEGYVPKSYEVNLSGASATQDIYLDPSTTPDMGAVRGRIRLERTLDPYDVNDSIVTLTDLDRPENGESVVEVVGLGMEGDYFANVLPGNHSVQCLAHGHSPSLPSAVRVRAGRASYLNITLKASDGIGTVLEGTVSDGGGGGPIRNATVVASCRETGSVYSTRTSESGGFFFAGPDPGSYVIAALAPGFEANSAEADVSEGRPARALLELDALEVPIEEPSAVWGIVHTNGDPARDAWAFTKDGQMTETGIFGIDGLYMFNGLEAGPLSLGSWAPEHHYESIEMNVPPGSAVRQDLHLQRMTGTSGASLVLLRVLDGSPQGSPLGGASVTIYRTDTSTGAVTFARTLEMPLDGGIGPMFPVPSDSGYKLRVVRSGHVLLNFTVGDGPEPLLPGDDFLVLGYRLNTLELRMGSSGLNDSADCTLWGFAATDVLGGQPVPGAAVFLERGQGMLSFTDDAGIYEFRVPEGDVDLMAAFPGSYGHSAYDSATGEWQVGGYHGDIASGETRRVDLVFQKRNTEHSTVAGRVVERATGEGLAGFDISMRTSQTTLPEQRTGAGGLFHFTPITDLFRPWRLLGNLPGHRVVRVDWRVVPDGPTTTGLDFPAEFEVPVSSLVWVDIFVERIPDEDLERSVLWGYVHGTSTTGAPIQGAMLSLSPSSAGHNFTDEDGMYSFELPPGGYEMTALAAGVTSVFNHDLVVGSLSYGPWSGELRAGEVRRVDMVLVLDEEGSSTIAGRVLRHSDRSPVNGFKVKAQTRTAVMDPMVTQNGRFLFSPLPNVEGPWTLSGESPEHTVVRVEYRTLPESNPLVQNGLPLTYQVLAGSVLWVDVLVNSSSSVKDARIVGEVFEPYSYGPLEAVTISVSSSFDLAGNLLTAETGADGRFEVTLPAGSYVLRMVKDGYDQLSAPIELGNAQEISQRFFMVPVAAGQGKATLFRFVDSVKGSPLKGLKVQIGGLGQFVTDDDGQVSVRVPFSGNYSFTVSGSVESIESVAAGNMSFGSDGKLHMVPGDEYILSMRPYVQTTPGKGSGLDEPLLVGLIIGIIVALVIGLIIGLLIARRPKEVVFFEE